MTKQMDAKEDYIKRFKHFRDDMTNEIPNRIIHSNEDQPMKYKVRKNWFQGVIIEGSNCIDDGYVSNKTTVMFWQFHKYFVKNMISRDTTKEDIDMGDRFLNTIIAELEK